jgi:hypothetical protein
MIDGSWTPDGVLYAAPRALFLLYTGIIQVWYMKNMNSLVLIVCGVDYPLHCLSINLPSVYLKNTGPDSWRKSLLNSNKKIVCHVKSNLHSGKKFRQRSHYLQSITAHNTYSYICITYVANFWRGKKYFSFFILFRNTTRLSTSSGAYSTNHEYSWVCTALTYTRLIDDGFLKLGAIIFYFDKLLMATN